MEEKLKLELDGVEVGLTNQPSRIEVGSIDWIGLDLIRIRPRNDCFIHRLFHNVILILLNLYLNQVDWLCLLGI